MQQAGSLDSVKFYDGGCVRHVERPSDECFCDVPQIRIVSD